MQTMNVVQQKSSAGRAWSTPGHHKPFSTCAVPRVARQGKTHPTGGCSQTQAVKCMTSNTSNCCTNESNNMPRNTLAASVLAALVLISPNPAFADQQQTWTGPAKVVDGDTLYIGEQKFRLYGVDAPEKTQACVDSRGQSYTCGLVSKDALAQKVQNQIVSCSRKAKDQYGREVAVCSLVSPFGSQDLNEWLVTNGYAVAYREYGKDYIAAEETAKAAKRGIWAGAFEYPAQWRKEEKAGIPHPPLVPGAAAGNNSLSPLVADLTGLAGQQLVSSNAVNATNCGAGVLPIKGNINAKGTKIYHMPGGPYYEKVLVEPEKGESYFCSEADAVKAGYRPVAGNTTAGEAAK